MELSLYRENIATSWACSATSSRPSDASTCATASTWKVRSDGGEVYFDVTMTDAWVWDIYRPARFAKKVRVVTFKDVNVEELAEADLESCPKDAF